jgi:Protein of unknown function (DUF1593)
MRSLASALALFAVLSASALAGAPLRSQASAHVDDYAGHPRVLVLTDIGNEPDDQMSLVRLLCYVNELDIAGLVATTSTWQRSASHPETLHALIAAYAEVRPNLLKHAPGWPTAANLDALVYSGQSAYGMPAVGAGQASAGSAAIIHAVDSDDVRPLWISIWGGANTLAQALRDVRAQRSAAELAKFVDRLRVYSISDQDDAGPWLRREFPDLFYIVKPSSPDGEEYASATWTGISGDAYYLNAAGADDRTVSNDWLERNIRSKGVLGKHYPKFMFIMEGDTPAFLGLIDNGLNAFRNPSWGGWGGRYVYRTPYGETRPIWTQGGDMFRRVSSRDRVVGNEGRSELSDQASIWRWREAFQHDFAARMDWTVKSFAAANHNPQLSVNGSAGTAPIVMAAQVGQPIALDARASRDPDGNELQFKWFHYAEAGFVPDQGLADLQLSATTGAVITATPTAACRPNWLPLNPCAGGVAHLILAVTDNGTPTLTSYRRIIITVPAPLSRAQ